MYQILCYLSNLTKMICDINFEKSRQMCASSNFQCHAFINRQNFHDPLLPGTGAQWDSEWGV